ncbi:MAG: hypothetical protein NVSMB31_18970 [Vulcanimicrobiaceae bacterium]
MATTIRTFAAAGTVLVLAACSHGSAPPPAASNVRAVSQVRQEIKTGLRAFGHHANKIALAHFNKALSLDPKSLEARYDRGITEEKMRAYGRAADDLGAVVKARPQWDGARLHLAAAQFHVKRYAEAARNFDLALKTSGKVSRLWLDDGVSYYKLHRYADARKRFARALDLAPKSGRAHFWLGMTYRHLGDRLKARNELALAAHSRDMVVRRAAKGQLAAR